MKPVLVSAGNVKRDRIQKIREKSEMSVDEVAENLPEQEILVQSVCETMLPKLVAEDIPLLFSLLSDVFPGVSYSRAEMDSLKSHIKKVCKDEYLVCGMDGEAGSEWTDKILQLYQITQLHHGLMMVGPSGSGKSAAASLLALRRKLL